MKQSVYVRLYHSKREHTILLYYISAYNVAISKITYIRLIGGNCNTIVSIVILAFQTLALTGHTLIDTHISSGCYILLYLEFLICKPKQNNYLQLFLRQTSNISRYDIWRQRCVMHRLQFDFHCKKVANKMIFLSVNY